MNSEESFVNDIKTTDSTKKETEHQKLEMEPEHWTTSEIGAMLGYNRQKVLEMINRYHKILLPYIGKRGNRNIIYKPDGAEIFKRLDTLLKQGFTEDEEIESLLVNEVGKILSRREPADNKMIRLVELMERKTKSYINEVVATFQETYAEHNKALVGMIMEQINSVQKNTELMKKENECLKEKLHSLKEEIHNMEIEKIKLQYEKELIEQKLQIMEEYYEKNKNNLKKRKVNFWEGF